MIDVAPFDGTDPIEEARKIVIELQRFSPELASRERWIVLNKVDLTDDAAVEALRVRVVTELDWQGPLYSISAIAGRGTRQLAGDIMTRLEVLDQNPVSEN